MAGRKSLSKTASANLLKPEAPRAVAIANTGIRTAGQFADLMSALMSDLIDGRISPQIGNATCNAGGKLLKVVEMQYKYGTTADGKRKTLQLALEETE